MRMAIHILSYTIAVAIIVTLYILEPFVSFDTDGEEHENWM